MIRFFVWQQGALHQHSTVLVCFHVKGPGVFWSCPHVEKELVFTILFWFSERPFSCKD